MVLKGRVFITKVLKESKFEAFKDLKEQDIIIVSMEIPSCIWWRDTCYTADIICKNIKTGRTSIISLNQVDEMLECFECIQLP